MPLYNESYCLWKLLARAGMRDLRGILQGFTRH